MSSEISNDKKKAIFTFTVNPNETLGEVVSISYKLGLKKPISNEVVLKATLKQEGVEINAHGTESNFIAVDEADSSNNILLGNAPINGDTITLTNLNDVLTDKILCLAYSNARIDTTNPADIVLTIEITN